MKLALVHKITKQNLQSAKRRRFARTVRLPCLLHRGTKFSPPSKASLQTTAKPDVTTSQVLPSSRQHLFFFSITAKPQTRLERADQTCPIGQPNLHHSHAEEHHPLGVTSQAIRPQLQFHRSSLPANPPQDASPSSGLAQLLQLRQEKSGF